MKRYTQEELDEKIRLHNHFIKNYKDGKKAVFIGADLSNLTMNTCSLEEAVFIGSDLSNCTIVETDFTNAMFENVNLDNAKIMYCDFRHAKIKDVSMKNARINTTRFYTTISENVNITDAVISNVRISDREIEKLKGNKLTLPMSCPETGEFIAYKKASGKIIKLFIPESAKRSSAFSKKCRCDKAIVLEIQTLKGNISKLRKVKSNFDPNFVYVVDKEVSVSNFDECRWNECSPGIHFFVNREDAVNY